MRRTLAAISQDHGFRSSTWMTGVERPANGLTHGLELQPGHGAKRGRFAVNVVWWVGGPTDWPTQPPPFAYRQRACRGAPGSGPESWVRHAESLEAILQPAIDFLDGFPNAESVLDAVSDGSLTPRDAFGADPGVRLYHWAVTARVSTRPALEQEKLKELLEMSQEWDLADESESFVRMIELAKTRFDGA